MNERPLRDDEKRRVLHALTESNIAPQPVCEEAVETCRFIPFHSLLPPVGAGIRPVIAFFALRRRASGITLGRKVYIRRHLFGRSGDLPLVLVTHEVAHVVQFLRDGTLPFLTRYLGEYLAARINGMSDREAYLRISYEQEARRVEQFLDGL